MSDLLKKLTSGRDTLRSVEVPELGITMWYRPVSLAEMKMIYGDAGIFTTESPARIVCRLALDSKGVRLFEDEHELALRNSGDAHILNRVAGWILGERSTLEAAEKN